MARVMSAIVDKILLAFFLSMTITVLCIDSQVLFPFLQYPSALKNLMNWYVDSSGDYLLKEKPAFFIGCVVVEIFIEAPLLIGCIYALIFGKRWFTTICLIYGVSTAATMVPILADILSSNAKTKHTLLAIYIPFLIMALVAVGRGLVSSSSAMSASSYGIKAKKRV